MDYKRIFKSRKTRYRILNMLRFIPDRPMIRLQYRIKMGRGVHLRKPERFSEKIQWYKLYYRNPVMKQCVNKFQAREFVKSRGLEEILIPLIAHYNKPEEIDWDALPEQFVMKTDHGGGGLNVIVCTDKSKMNPDSVLPSVSFSSPYTDKRSGGREWAYSEIPRGIIVEQLLVNREHPEAGVNDYKFFCYNGEPKYVVVDTDRFIGHKRNFYDTDWNNLHVTSDCPACSQEIDRPPELEEMLRVASRLSEGFPYVRVDLYDVDGKVYFGEMTFYPWSGYVLFEPDEWDYQFGEDFELKRY